MPTCFCGRIASTLPHPQAPPRILLQTVNAVRTKTLFTVQEIIRSNSIFSPNKHCCLRTKSRNSLTCCSMNMCPRCGLQTNDQIHAHKQQPHYHRSTGQNDAPSPRSSTDGKQRVCLLRFMLQTLVAIDADTVGDTPLRLRLMKFLLVRARRPCQRPLSLLDLNTTIGSHPCLLLTSE